MGKSLKGHPKNSEKIYGEALMIYKYQYSFLGRHNNNAHLNTFT